MFFAFLPIRDIPLGNGVKENVYATGEPDTHGKTKYVILDPAFNGTQIESTKEQIDSLSAKGCLKYYGPMEDSYGNMEYFYIYTGE